MEIIIADTDVLIDYLHGYHSMAERIAMELKRGLLTTVISAFELWVGSFGSKKREQAVSTLLKALTIISLEQEDAHCAAEIQQALKKEGQTLGMADSLIAGICVRHRAPLLTRNRKHFQGIQNLSLADL